MRSKVIQLFGLILMVTLSVNAQKAKHTFTLGTSEFLLDGQPFQMISGEMHPARIPAEYWRHRIKMAKAMGCNTISAYIFWNYHEAAEGVYDFSSGNHNLAEFIRIVAEEEMWLILRPGPYVCAEWELGGIPPYLLRIPDIKLRCMDSRYMAAAERYIARLAEEIKPFLVTKGGPLLMLQVENEYGSFGNDRNYLLRLKEVWKSHGIDVPTFTGDGPTTYMLEAGSLPGSAVGLDSGSSLADFALANKMNPGVPVFSSETYPGWLTHWGEKWVKPDTSGLLKEVKFLMDNKKSFNFYVIHGGTNFGFTAGANSGRKGYEPDVTSYDYDAPVNEQGQATPKYMALRKLLGSYLPKGKKLPMVPDPIPAIELTSVIMQPFSSVWDNLPQPVNSVQPKTFEAYGQDYGFILYKTELVGHKKGKLTVTDIHDYATVFLNGKFIGNLDRREGLNTIDIPASDVALPVLEIFVEAMGRINFAQYLIDRKGITDRVTLNGMTLMNWKVYNIPMDSRFIYDLRSSGKNLNKPGIFFKGSFLLTKESGNLASDTFIDVSNYNKGIVWVNGHNLGRYWEIGPQKRLFCPAPWLKEGMNEIIIFDLHQTEAKPVTGAKTGNGQGTIKESLFSDVKWSVRMVNSVLTKSDSLIYYVDRNPKWAYDVAFLGMAIDRLGNIDPKYSKYMEDWVNHFVKPDGSVTDYRMKEYNLDRIFPGRDIIILNKRNPDPNYKIALDNFIEQLKSQPKTKSGGYWHKNIYPWQMWLDGIYMASTFMAEYAKEFNAPVWFDVATNQTKMIYEKTLDPQSGLLMHAWDESRTQKWCDPATGKSHYPWSRATGWYILAIEDILEYLPENHSDRAALITILQKTCDALLRVRDPKTGLWFQVLNQGGREGNYIEGSGSAMYTYAFARGAHKGYLDKKYLTIANSAFDGIIKELITVDAKGFITMHNICGGCGLGGNPYRDGSYEYYVNEKRIDNDTKGIAPFILAAIELAR